jgi:hypothetical protein
MRNRRLIKLVVMLRTLDELLGEEVNSFCVSRNLHHELMDSYSDEEQRRAERRYRELAVINDKLITKIQINLVESGEDSLYEQAKKIFY